MDRPAELLDAYQAGVAAYLDWRDCPAWRRRRKRYLEAHARHLCARADALKEPMLTTHGRHVTRPLLELLHEQSASLERLARDVA